MWRESSILPVFIKVLRSCAKLSQKNSTIRLSNSSEHLVFFFFQGCLSLTVSIQSDYLTLPPCIVMHLPFPSSKAAEETTQYSDSSEFTLPTFIPQLPDHLTFDISFLTFDI